MVFIFLILFSHPVQFIIIIISTHPNFNSFKLVNYI
jgi:hypothetical protein